MAKTLFVQAQPTAANIRKVVLNEAGHPTATGEAWIVAYEEPRLDGEGRPIEPANPVHEVADTPGVRRAIMAGDLAEVAAPTKAKKAESA